MKQRKQKKNLNQEEAKDMKRLYRARNGQVFGVCQGIADWRELPVDAVRFIVLVAIVVTGVFPGLAIYVLLGLLLPVEPECCHKDTRHGESRGSGHTDSERDAEQAWDYRFYGERR
jgi:phage shock protein C